MDKKSAERLAKALALACVRHGSGPVCRIEAKLSQAELAKMLGVTQARISKYEQGERRIDMLKLKRICDALRLPLVEFSRRFEDGCR